LAMTWEHDSGIQEAARRWHGASDWFCEYLEKRMHQAIPEALRLLQNAADTSRHLYIHNDDYRNSVHAEVYRIVMRQCGYLDSLD